LALIGFESGLFFSEIIIFKRKIGEIGFVLQKKGLICKVLSTIVDDDKRTGCLGQRPAGSPRQESKLAKIGGKLQRLAYKVFSINSKSQALNPKKFQNSNSSNSKRLVLDSLRMHSILCKGAGPPQSAMHSKPPTGKQVSTNRG
jgi:hypothetical protein